MDSLTSRERRLIALGGLVLLLALVWLIVAAPILGGFAQRRSERAELADTLARDQRLLWTFPALRARQRALAANATVYAFQTGDAAAALGAAEARVGADIEAAGGELHAVRSQPSSPGTVRLRADAALTLPVLVRLLQRLKTERPYPVVQELSVARSAAAPGQAPGALEMRIDVVYAYAAAGR